MAIGITTLLHSTALTTILGTSAGDSNFGAFTGDTIPTGSSAKGALQALETAVEIGRPADNVAKSLSAIKAAKTSLDILLYDSALFTWTLGDYTDQADDINVIKSDGNDLSVGAWVRQKAASISFTPSGASAVSRPTADVLAAIGLQAKSYGAVADGATDDRTPLGDLITAAAGGIALLPDTYATSAGAANSNPAVSDPDPSALYVTTNNTIIDGLGTGKLIGTGANKGLLNIKSASVFSPPTNITVQNFQGVVQAYGTPEDGGLQDDYFAFRYEGARSCKLLNIHIAQCELGFTDEFAQTASGTRYYTFNASSDVSTASDTITVNKDLVGAATTHNFTTGDMVAMNPTGGVAWGTGSTLPTGLYPPYRYYVIVVDTTTIKLANSYDDAIAGTAVDLTAAGSGSVAITLTNRQSHNNILNNFVVDKCAYLGVQLGGCAYGHYTNIVINGVDGDGHSRGGTHGVRLDGFFMALTEFNQISATVNRMANGLSLQSFSEHNSVHMVANDCQNGVSTTRPVDAIAAAKHNDIFLNANRCDFGIYEDGNSFNEYTVDILNPKTKGIYATNGGGITGLGVGNIYKGRIRRTLPGSTPRLAEFSGVDTTIDLMLEGSGTTASDTSYGLLVQSTASDISGSVRVTKCQIGVQLSGTGSHLFVKADNCGTAMSIPGNNHVVFADIDGNISITGNNNTIIGRVNGTVTNTGTGNRIYVKAATGFAADTGTADGAAHATYAAGTALTFGTTYTQSELTALATRLALVETALQGVTQGQKAVKDALLAQGQIGA